MKPTRPPWVAVLVHRFPCLTETFVQGQVLGLLERGMEVTVFARRGSGDPFPPGAAARGLAARVVTGPPVPDPLFRAAFAALPASFFHGPPRIARSLVRAIASRRRRHRPDVVHCQFGDLAHHALAARRLGLLSGKLVVSFRGFDVFRRPVSEGPRVYERVFAAGDLFLAVTDDIARRLLELGCPPPKLRVHRSGIDLRLFPFAPRRPDPARPLRLLSVGRLVEKKGFGNGIEAVARLRDAGRDARYEVVGEGPERPALERRIADLGLAERVRLAGAMDHARVRERLARADVLLCPSVTAGSGDREGIPNAIKEAMAAGVPVVASRHAGIPELVEDGETGLMAPEGDPEALAGCVASLLADPAGAGRMARRARSRVEEEYDLDRLNDELAGLLRGLG